MTLDRIDAAQDPRRARRRRARRVLAAVPDAAAAAAGLGPACRRATVRNGLRGRRRRVRLRRPGGRGRRGEAAGGRLRPDRRVPHDVPDRPACWSPVAQRSGAPVLLLNLQPTEAMDHASFDTGAWLAYCGACPLPEMANAFRRVGVEFRSVSGLPRGRARLDADRALDQGGGRPGGAAARTARPARAPLPGHDGRLHRPDPGVRPARRPRRDPGDRRPAGAGREGHRRRDRRAGRAGPRGVHCGRVRSGRRLRLGRAGFRGAGPARRGLRPRLAGLLPPRPRRRDARAASAPGSSSARRC